MTSLQYVASIVGTPAMRRLAAFSGADAVVHEAKRRRTQQRDSRAETAAQASTETERPTASMGKWPSKLNRRAVGGDVGRSRHEKEKSERSRWVRAAASIVMEAELPASKMEDSTRRVPIQIAQGRRVRTIKKRVSDWRKARRFWVSTLGICLPRSLDDILAYVECRAEEPVPPQFHGPS